MRDLARRRRERDLRISRGHLWAAVIGAALIGIVGFIAGFWVGGGRSAPAPAVAAAASEESLVDLLARVNELSLSGDSAERLTFPDVLAGAEGEVELPEPPAHDRASVIPPGQPGKRPFQVLVAPDRAEDRPAIARLVASLGVASESEPDGPLVVRVADLDQARALRDRLLQAVDDAEIDVEVTVQPVAGVAAAPAQP